MTSTPLNGAVGLITTDQRMALFRDAIKIAPVEPESDRPERIIAVFRQFLNTVCEGLPLPLDQVAEDPMEHFFLAKCDLAPHRRTQAATLYAAFADFCREQYPDNTVPTMAAFGVSMRGRFVKERGQRVHYVGIGLKAESTMP